MKNRISLIVIGASVGGIEALRLLLPDLSHYSDLAVCVCQHMDRNSRFDYSRLFRVSDEFQVKEIQDKDEIKAQTIYFAPPGYHAYIERDAYFSLSLDEAVNWSRPSIDVLFESAAKVFGPRVLGILLTGGNGDGADGLVEIKRFGGQTIVQDPKEALADVMPRLAIDTGCADYILPISHMGKKVGQILRMNSSIDRSRRQL